GWLNRALVPLQSGDRRLGIAIGGAVPLVLRGGAPVASWEPPGLATAAPEFLVTLSQIYAADALLGPALSDGLRAQHMSTEVLGDDMVKGGRGFGPLAFAPLAGAA